MTQEEILALISKGESETIEFKENFEKETVETVSAFANTKGGIIVVGISDDGGIKGIQIGKHTINNWLNQISQSTEPALIPQVEVLNYQRKNIVIIKIAEFPIKPLSVKGKCFKRSGNANRIMTPQEIANMYLASASMSWDAFPAQESSMEDIDTDKLNQLANSCRIVVECGD